MTLYAITLFLHVVGTLGLFIAVGLEWTSLSRLRNAASVDQVREWLPVLGALRKIGGPSTLVLLVSGIYMMTTAWRGAAWPGIGLVAMVLIAVLGVVLTGPRIGPIARSMSSAQGAVTEPLRERLRDPVLVMSVWLRTALALGVVYIMCVKPGAAGALTAMGVAVSLGILGGLSALPARAVAVRPE